MKKTPKQIAALLCVVLLVLLYVATLVVSLLDFPGSEKLFAACLLATIGLPILLWIYIWSIGRLTDKKEKNETVLDTFSDENED